MSIRRQHLVTLCGLCVACLLTVTAGAADDAAVEHFRTAVAPVLAAKCVSCHRPDNLKGGLDLTTRATVLKGGEGGVALTAGQPDASPLYTRSISANNERPEMPAKGDPLTKAEAEQLKAWITAGAPWPESIVLKEKAKADASFWSFQPLAKVEPPNVTDAPARWSTHPIDRFILTELRAHQLTPNASADPATFIRRATYDLWGLPPTPAAIAEFAQTCAAERATDPLAPEIPEKACAALIDRLLDSPHYGEHWGRHWLDVIRFGESRGYERNEIITNLWPFRDYVIDSFNADKPFDRFVLEHLAGDVIGRDQPVVEIGSAFLVAGPYDDVGNQDAAAAAQIRADQMDEMIRASSEAFLGLTLGCARCHDHKFDPLTTRDYYALYSTFAGTVHGPREVSTAEARTAREQRLQPLQAARVALVEQRDALQKAQAERAQASEPELAKTWTRPRASRYATEETFEPVDAKFVRLTVTGNDGPNPQGTNYRLDEFEVWTDEATPRNVALAAAGAVATGSAREAKDFAGAYAPALAIDGKFGERFHSSSPEFLVTLAKPERIRRVLFSSDRTKALPEDSPITIFVGEYRLEVSIDGERWTSVATSADRQPKTEALKQVRLTQHVNTPKTTARLKELSQEIARLDREIAAVPALPVWWVGTHRAAPGPFQVYVGGNPQRPGDKVVPSSLEVLSELPSAYQLDPGTADEGARRAAFARWLTAADNPLTPRVLANRIWHYHFGTGIVSTPSDFGFMGARPSHPAMLDWLAGELLSQGWKLKPLHRLIMTSQTYRQSAVYREAAAQVDAESRLLWRFPPRRLSAEEVRDTLLSVAGKLNPQRGGPGFRLYEYQQDNVATYVPLNVHGPETYRRSVYHHNARAARVDVMTDFDCPDPAFADPSRAATTTPLQALTLMNHRFAYDMTQALTERLQREASDPAGQIRHAFQLSFARDPSPEEFTASEALVRQHGLRAFCRALLNSNELIYLN